MSGVGIKINTPDETIPRLPSVGRAILFIMPSIIITVFSMTLFARLNAFTPEQQNTLTLTIIVSIILSLLGMAGMQVIIYRINESRDYFSDGTIYRAVRAGLIFSTIYTIIAAAILYPFFTQYLHFSLAEYFYFSILLFLLSGTWILVSVFWSAEKYGHTALFFLVSYIAIFAFTMTAYRIDPAAAITGYTAGTAVQFMLFSAYTLVLAKKPKSHHKLAGDFIQISTLFSENAAAIAFNIVYVLAIFLDKFIIWCFQGGINGQVISVSGTYTAGSFLGLMPMFSIVTIAYFSQRTKLLTDERYNGTLDEIHSRVVKYKRIYRSGFTATWLLALVIGLATSCAVYFFMYDYRIMQVLIPVSTGSVFLALILFDSAALSVFRKAYISTLAVTAVVFFELASIPFITIDAGYSAAGFLVGSFSGFLLSHIYLRQLFSSYEYNMFNMLLKIKSN